MAVRFGLFLTGQTLVLTSFLLWLVVPYSRILEVALIVTGTVGLVLMVLMLLMTLGEKYWLCEVKDEKP
jgi:hypothetical protein